ncbi:H-type small acid-soluble spore protein [Thermosediminibacter oceani]|uniref:Small acid-soluble spore protein, H-type n=1 Tax=Thermosediminibacter oceani (strain ATCC BAA-1034 / DSM 16646 / JW/IW-1228P) TaxID=555079 RepID=D9S092_THEOJ|nr:H-type small acid-soluble spore protein [Thermosediminibacter oceani]ADL07020.1 small acid-soluble spore protein, H-type [Thermosediminibacter oceani DSM 16646]
MDFQRAQEILNSSDTYEVFYQGKLVWIKGLNPDDNTADVEILGEKIHTKVPVNELVEGGSFY